jgi:hypothetical protein
MVQRMWHAVNLGPAGLTFADDNGLLSISDKPKPQEK